MDEWKNGWNMKDRWNDIKRCRPKRSVATWPSNTKTCLGLNLGVWSERLASNRAESWHGHEDRVSAKVPVFMTEIFVFFFL